MSMIRVYHEKFSNNQYKFYAVKKLFPYWMDYCQEMFHALVLSCCTFKKNVFMVKLDEYLPINNIGF